MHVDEVTAAAVVSRVRGVMGAKSGEYKSAELMRTRRRSLPLWFLGPDGPLHDHARVHLIDTRYFVLARVLDVLLGSAPVSGTDSPGRDPDVAAMARTLYVEGERTYGSEAWNDFLTLAANMFRTNNRWLPADPIGLFYAALHRLRTVPAPPAVTAIIDRLPGTLPVAQRMRAAHLPTERRTPLLEPLIPALTRSVESWSAQTTELTVVHDEQSALTGRRIAEIASNLQARRPGRRLIEVRLVDSRQDPRVQVADYLAGIAQRLARDVLRGVVDGQLTDLLTPLVDPESVVVRPWPTLTST